MIRINLLGVERVRPRKATPAFFDASQRLTLAASLVLVAAALGVGWWYWHLQSESSRLDAEIAAAQQEATRLRSVLAEVQQFEGQRQRLQERVSLIEQLRTGQSIPVQLLDHVSRSLPDMLWLTGFEQQGEQVTIQGQSTTLIALSDFVGNLAGGAMLERPIEIVNSEVQPASGPAGAAAELIQFTVRARINNPADDTVVAAAAPPPARRRAGGPR